MVVLGMAAIEVAGAEEGTGGGVRSLEQLLDIFQCKGAAVHR